jgi:tripartite-type tricarboxylate transporter receptor subunit TctC
MNQRPSSPARRQLLCGAAALCCVPTLRAQAYPSRVLRLVLPNAAGSAVDTLARLLAPPMAANLGQAIVIENVAGSGGLLGMQQLLRSPRDGYTFGLVASNFAIAPNLYKLPYDSERDIEPVCVAVNGPMVLAVNASVPATNLKELIALARSRPPDRSLTYASAGVGTLGHLVAELLAMSAGVRLLHVPYKGQNGATTDLVSGVVDAGFAVPSVYAPFFASGKLRPIGLSTRERLPILPGVAPLAESGLPDFNLGGWQMFIAAHGTPKAAIERLNAAARAAMRTPEVQKEAAEGGHQIVGSTVGEARAWARRELEQFAKLSQKIGIRPE